MPKPRTFFTPANQWQWPFPVSFSHGIRKDEMVFVGGQVALDANGGVQHPGDIWKQLELCMMKVEAVLRGCAADFEDVVKLEVYYVTESGFSETQLLEALKKHFRQDVPPALYIVPLPRMALPGLMISVEAIAMNYVGGMRMEKQAANPEGHWRWPFSHGVRCGQMIFVGAQMPLDRDGKVQHPQAPVEQAQMTLANIERVLGAVGADLEDVFNINTRYVGHGTTEDWARAANIRAMAWRTSGKNGTGVPIPDVFGNGLTIRQEVTAMRGVDGARLWREPVFPEGSWDWPIPVRVQQGVRVGKMMFVGGQISADKTGRAVYPDDLGAQTALVLKFIRRCVEDAGGSLADIVKCKGYFKLDPDEPLASLQQCMATAAAFFNDPGPTLTLVPLEKLGLEGLNVEIEAVAMID